MKGVTIKDPHIHPDVKDGDDLVPMVKGRMKKVGMGAHGMKPHTRLDRKSGGAAKWIQKAVPESHKGMLHKALGVPQGEKIPEAKLEKAADSSNSHMRHMAQFAKNVKK
jgi:hypothetical protein